MSYQIGFVAAVRSVFLPINASIKVICDCIIERSSGDFTKVLGQINNSKVNFIVEKNNDGWPLINFKSL
jgi:hypothetical protein